MTARQLLVMCAVICYTVYYRKRGYRDAPCIMNTVPKPTTSPQQSPTAEASPDHIGIGRTSGQRTAEILAALRAELTPNPLTRGLASTGGLIAARLMRALISDDKLNFSPTRVGAFAQLVRNALVELPEEQPPIYVDLAAGFSPRGVILAQERPDLQVIEIDLPDVVAEKQRRLQRSLSLTDIPNVQWRGADLGTNSLLDLLGETHPSVISSEGLLPYLTEEAIQQLLTHANQMLQPGGHFIGDFTIERGRQGVAQALAMFTRLASLRSSDSPNWAPSEDEILGLFRALGYDLLRGYSLPQLAEMFDLLAPVPDAVLIVDARKPIIGGNDKPVTGE